MDENELSKVIVESAIEVHRTLGGPGLMESVYEEALAWELVQKSVSVERQKEIPILYKGIRLGTPFRIDMLVGGLVIVECKASSVDQPIFTSQILTYLRLADKKLGLVINFGQRLIKHGIHRVVNGLGEGWISAADKI